MTTVTRPELIACAFGILVGALAYYYLLTGQLVPALPLTATESTHQHDEMTSEHHTHADFHIRIEERLLDLARPELMTTDTQELHPDVHLHDGVGTAVHFHAPDISFGAFLTSLGFSYTEGCLTTMDDETYCDSSDATWTLYVNGEPHAGDWFAYQPADLDRLLLFYGSSTDPQLDSYLKMIPDEACIYSGSCPERGTAPPESCGLTCEL